MQDRIQSSSALPALGQSAGAVLVPTVGSGEARNLTPLAGKVQNHSNPARVELDKTSFVHKLSNTNENGKMRCALSPRTVHPFIGSEFVSRVCTPSIPLPVFVRPTTRLVDLW